MEYQAEFQITGEIKQYSKFTTSGKPYGFVKIRGGKTGKAYISVSLFGVFLEQLSESDTGKDVHIEGYISTYKEKSTGNYVNGFTASSIQLIDSEQDHEVGPEDVVFNDDELPW